MGDKKRAAGEVGDICLYGNRQTGAGWIATAVDGQQAGDGEPREGRCFTLAVALAVEALEEMADWGRYSWAWVYEPSGRRRAKVDLMSPGYFGELVWEPAPVYEIDLSKLAEPY